MVFLGQNELPHLETLHIPGAFLLVAIEDGIDLVLVVDKDKLGLTNVRLALNGNHLADAIRAQKHQSVEFGAYQRLRVLAGGFHRGANEEIDAVVIDLHVLACNLLAIHFRDARNLGTPGEQRPILVQESLDIGNGVFHLVFQVVFRGGLRLANGIDVVLILVQVKEGDAPDGDLQQAGDIVVRHIALELVSERLQAIPYRLHDLGQASTLLDALVDAVLNENPFQGQSLQCLDFVVELQFQLGVQQLLQALDIAAKDLAHRHLNGLVVLNHQDIRMQDLLAIRVCVELLDGLFRVNAAHQSDFDIHLRCGKVVDGRHLQLATLGGTLNGRNQRIRGGIRGHFPNHHLLVAIRLNLGTDADLTQPIRIPRDVHQTARREIGIELERLVLQNRDLRLQQFREIVGEDVGSHTHRNAVRTHHQQRGDFAGKHHGLLVAPVIGIHVFRHRGIEKHLATEFAQAALDITPSSRGIPREDVTEIPLLVYEKFRIRQHHQRILDGRIAVRVILHRFADHTADLVHAAVVYRE